MEVAHGMDSLRRNVGNFAFWIAENAFVQLTMSFLTPRYVAAVCAQVESADVFPETTSIRSSRRSVLQDAVFLPRTC